MQEKETKDNDDLKRAAKILDEDHYGLDDVRRIIEYLAVQLTDDIEDLYFVRSPGGKTSARSIAGTG